MVKYRNLNERLRGIMNEANVRTDKYAEEIRNAVYGLNISNMVQYGYDTKTVAGIFCFFVPPSEYFARFHKERGNKGFYNPRTNCIYVKFNVDRNDMCRTLQHELEHAFDHKIDGWMNGNEMANSITGVQYKLSVLANTKQNALAKKAKNLIYYLWNPTEVNAFATEFSSKEEIDERIDYLKDLILWLDFSPMEDIRVMTVFCVLGYLYNNRKNYKRDHNEWVDYINNCEEEVAQNELVKVQNWFCNASRFRLRKFREVCEAKLSMRKMKERDGEYSFFPSNNNNGEEITNVSESIFNRPTFLGMGNKALGMLTAMFGERNIPWEIVMAVSNMDEDDGVAYVNHLKEKML